MSPNAAGFIKFADPADAEKVLRRRQSTSCKESVLCVGRRLTIIESNLEKIAESESDLGGFILDAGLPKIRGTMISLLMEN